MALDIEFIVILKTSPQMSRGSWDKYTAVLETNFKNIQIAAEKKDFRDRFITCMELQGGVCMDTYTLEDIARTYE